ncbi:hypothetical protein FRC14_000008 [Serendipita sp. 396]|nr:hypothetical protein FRC14_000008 [Serendipita sp. 396]KAG8789913.1 hypothetical protein FRC15_000105 [Serendipita sp. 397]KAG8825912.1 hypothetical protein FRC19_010171 [Serendipita sp. 401]KAG8836601.1 hypothetical protein FRC18_011045 [Serendipita sp. 400]KAG8872959.1 hypothetical protein FRC20_008838 [Serendipita sp. 405]KAG9055807.1 hypothetical protein FS842_001089 [Serendipita sp. 407]
MKNLFGYCGAVALALSSVVIAAYPNPIAMSGAYTGVHDPSALCQRADGLWFLFSTAVGIAIRTSRDRVSWTNAGVVWPNGASWTSTYTGGNNENLWAPDCTFRNGQFYLYYSASTFGSRKSGMFLARSSTGVQGSWTNDGLVYGSTTSSSYNAIDPNLLIDGSKWYLVFGSWSSGIAILDINPSTGKPLSTSLTKLASRSSSVGIEAPVIIKSGSYYYLFTSWDKCCAGLSSTYNIRVGRSTSVKGPYVDQAGVNLTSGGGTLVLATHGSIVGPGGQSVFQTGGVWYLVYHYYTSSGSNLGINRLTFSTGWPVAY